MALTACLFAASGWEQLRVPVGGLALHPYLLVLGPIFVFRVLPRLGVGSLVALAPLLGFVFWYTLASLTSGGAISEFVKLAASLAVFVTAQSNIKKTDDLAWVILGLVVGMGILGLRGLSGGSAGLVGINPMEGVANKNAYGAYAAPALAAAGLVLLGKVRVPRWQWWVVAGSSLAIIGAIFSTASRGSWAVAIVVGLFWLGQDRSPRAVMFLGTLGVGTFLVLSYVTTTDVIEHRLQQTADGTRSDEAREGLVEEAFSIALEHPIMGVGVQPMYRELARRVRARGPAINAHNVYAHIAASSGLLALFLFLWGMARLAGFRKKSPREVKRFSLLAVSIIMFEGLFTHEVLYVPSMWLLLGIAYRMRQAQRPLPVNFAETPTARPLRSGEPAIA